MLDAITPLILTRDEEANIARTLGQLAWARDVVVVDSLSTDATVFIARKFPNVRVVDRAFDTHERQWNFGLAEVHTEWALTLDADYVVPDAFVREIAALDPADDVAGYEAAFTYAIDGKPLRASLYPPRIVLVRRARASFVQDGHTQRVRVDGRVEHLREKLIHDDRKPRARFAERQRKYMQIEAAKLRATPMRELNLAGKLRRMRVVAPLAVLAHTLVVKRAALDGRAGWRYAYERFLAELILSRELFRR